MSREQQRKIVQAKEYIAKCISKGLGEEKAFLHLFSSGFSIGHIRRAHTCFSHEEKAKRIFPRMPKRRHHLGYYAGDIMDKDVVCIGQEKLVKEAIELIKSKESGYALVMDGKSPAGIITGRDILMNITASGKINNKRTCEEMMNTPLITCKHDESLFDVCARMKLNDVDRIPVLKNRKLVGIITSYSLIHIMSYG